MDNLGDASHFSPAHQPEWPVHGRWDSGVEPPCHPLSQVPAGYNRPLSVRFNSTPVGLAVLAWVRNA